MTMFDDDLATMFSDTLITVAASIGAQSTRGMFNWEDVLETDSSGGLVSVSRQVLAIQAGTLSGAVNGASITIDGSPYRVRDVRHAGQHQLKVIVA